MRVFHNEPHETRTGKVVDSKRRASWKLCWDATQGWEGWFIRVTRGSQERDLPMKGRKNSSIKTLRRRVRETLRDGLW